MMMQTCEGLALLEIARHHHTAMHTTANSNYCLRFFCFPLYFLILLYYYLSGPGLYTL